VGSDNLEFRFFDKNGNVVLDFRQDYISATTDLAKYPSGLRVAGGVGGRGGDGVRFGGEHRELDERRCRRT